MNFRVFQLLFLLLNCLAICAQEQYVSGVELSLDQDSYADWTRDSLIENKNFAVGMRIGLYGELADHTYLGLPWVRRKIDGFIVDKLLERGRFRLEERSHSFVFMSNGFSPTHISDTTEIYRTDEAAGYSLANDRPFSSFTGFRSTRRLQGNKLFAHSARQVDFAVNTSFTFGLASLGLAQGIDNLLGRNRPSAIIWDKDENKAYPTGQTIPTPLPLIMYSLSAEAVIWRPLRKVVLQLRPEINLGTYTDLRIGLDIGKVMNVERHVDNLSYVDANNPGLVMVNNETIGLAIVGGITGKVVFYNAHINALYSSSSGHYYSFSEMRKFAVDGYVGIKLQLFKKIEINYSINTRTSEFDDIQSQRTTWGTIGFKFLLAPEGEGCYDKF